MTLSAQETTEVPRRIYEGEVVYEDRFQRIRRVVAEFDGFTKEYVVSDRGQRAAMVAVRQDRGGDELLLVRQYRLLINSLSLELPGGRVDDRETPRDAAVRECLEETGVRCRDATPLLTYQAGLDTWKNPTHVFVARDLVEPPSDRFRGTWIPLARCLEHVFTGSIVDHMSILAILAYRTWKERQP